MRKVLPSSAWPGNPFRGPRHGDYGKPAEPDWREIDWQAHLHQIDIDGTSVNYVDYGEGDEDLHPVVFVHGLGGAWQNFLENIPRMAAEGRRVVALDLPGAGFSEMPSEEITISGYGRVVNALCDELDLGEVCLVGNSMGGFVSAETAIQFPDRVERLVLVSAAGITTSNLAVAPLVAGSRVFAIIAARAAAMTDSLVVRPHLRVPMFAQIVRYPRDVPTDTLYEITRSSGRKGFTPALRAILTYDFSDRLPEIRCPTLIVWGQDDMLVPNKDADKYERLIPDSRKVVFDDTGHMPMLERPRRFNDLVVEWLGEVDDAPAREEDLGGGANVRGPRGRGNGNGSNGAADRPREADAA